MSTGVFGAVNRKSAPKKGYMSKMARIDDKLGKKSQKYKN